jgi:hypothetical protein
LVESTNTHGAFKQTLVGMFQVPQMILMVDMMVKVFDGNEFVDFTV